MTNYAPTGATWSVAVGAAAIIAALSSSDVILSITRSDGFAKSFMPTYNYLEGSGGYGPLTGAAYSTVFPSFSSYTEVTDPAGSGQVGQVKLVLTPGSSDTVNSSSVLNFTLDANAIVVYIAGSTTFD